MRSIRMFDGFGVGMSAWGYALFSDDTASDVRSDYRELIEDGAEDSAATKKIINDYAELLDDPDDGPIFWLALATSQSKIGRLEPAVLIKALAVLDQGLGLDRWRDEGPKVLAKRQAALEKVRAQLTGPQSERKKVRRPWRYVTDLAPGNVLAFQTESDNYVLLRVAQVDDARVSAAPYLVLLDHRDNALPSREIIERLEDRGDDPWDSRDLVWHTKGVLRAAKYRKKDVDFSDAGFRLLDAAIQRPDDHLLKPHVYLAWNRLADELNRLF